MGILIPLALAAYGLRHVLHPRMFNRFTGNVIEGEGVVGAGIGALGLAVFCHGIGFVPYQRVPGLRFVVAGLGVGVFFLGLWWKNVSV